MSSESESCASDDASELAMMPDGRLLYRGALKFDFRAFTGALSPDVLGAEAMVELLRQCETVFKVRAQELEYSSGCTYWIQADAKPRNPLEKAALDIFAFHTVDAILDKKESGAEWWTQVIDDEDDIGWHWDKDYGLEAQGINVHPHIATVTYFTPTGGPTVVLEHPGPIICAESSEGDAVRAWISRPQVGKHISFDGRYLHGAPSDLRDLWQASLATNPPPLKASAKGPSEVGAASAEFNRGATSRRPAKRQRSEVAQERERDGGSAGGSTRRVTFLVNIWVNHKPVEAEQLPHKTSRLLGRGEAPVRMSAAVEESAMTLVAPSGLGQGDIGGGSSGPSDPGKWCIRSWEFGEVGKDAEEQVHEKHVVRMPLPGTFAAPDQSQTTTCVELVFAPDHPASVTKT